MAPVAEPESSRRAVSLIAVLTLFAGVVDNFAASAAQPLSTTLVLASAFAAIPLLAVVVLAVRSNAALMRVDLAALVTGIVLNLASFRGAATSVISTGTDERLINQAALRAFVAGHNPYTQTFPLIGADGNGTPLFDGRTATTFGYPPFPLELGRLFHAVDGRFGSMAVVDVVTVVVLGVALFFTLPAAWRPAVTVVLFGLNREHVFASAGYGVVVAAALLCAALYRWPQIGAGGAVGRRGAVQAGCLGLACASHQQAWLVAGFVGVALLGVRRAELGWSRAGLVLARIVGIAGLTFVAANLPFIVMNAHAWAHALASVFTQKAIVYGQGWALPLMLAHGGSGGIQLVTVATVLLVAVLALLLWFGLPRLAPAVAIFGSLAFALSSRTADVYVAGFWPVWLVTAGTTNSQALTQIWSRFTPLPNWVRARRGWAIGVVAALVAVPSVVFVLGVVTPPPVTLRPLAASITPGGRIVSVSVVVRNRSGQRVRPTFYVDLRTSITHRWTATAGPTTLAPGQSAAVTLVPSTPLEPASVAPNLWVFATVGTPEGLAAHRIALGSSRITLASRPNPPTPLAIARARCFQLVMAGHTYDCSSQFGLAQVPR